MASTTPSLRDSWTTSSPTDTDAANLSRVIEATEGASSVSLNDKVGVEDRDRTEGGDTDAESVYTEKNASIYLDANEDGPSVAEILKELRELPDTPKNPDRLTTPGPTTPATPATPLLMLPTASHPLPPTVTPPILPPKLIRERSSSSHRHNYQGRRRSGVRHSFSSAIRVSKMVQTGDVDDSGGRAEAVVELHEESAAAFQDFLFWCYPQ